METGAFGHAAQSTDVFGETGTAETNACFEKARSDPSISANTLRNNSNIGAHPLTEPSDVIDERDLRCQEGIGGVFDQLGRTVVHAQNWSLQRPIEFRHQF